MCIKTMMTSQEFSYALRIPRDRIGVLVGKEGAIKNRIQQETKTSISIDSQEGEIVVSANDGLSIFVAKDIILAIGRGFNPELALLLLKTDYSLDVISLKDAARNKNDSSRIKGRIIGEKGKTRRILEDMTQAYVVIYGKTISIIGEIQAVIIARKAIEMIIGGSPHRNVYKWLERQKKIQARREFSGEE